MIKKPLRLIVILVLLAAAAVCFWSLRPESGDAAASETLAETTPDTSAAADTDTDNTTDDPALSAVPETPAETTPDTVDGLPVGKLVITPERRDYKDGTLTISIPKLKMSRLVYGGTGSDQLRQGVGLFDYAQLPGEGNRNVSLAGHRNGRSNGVVNDHAPFYYIDTLTDGDYIYLYDSEHIYRYLYAFTEIIEADDWSYIKTTGDSVVTLVSCHPIGVSDHRIVVRGTLDEVLTYTKDYAFPASKEAAS